MAEITKEEICCPNIDIKKYDLKAWQWKQKPFMAVTIIQLFHMPLNFGASVKYAIKQIERHKLGEPSPQMMLYGKEGLFWAKILFEVQKPHPDAKQMLYIDGNFISKSCQGPYSGLSQEIASLSDYCKKKFSKEPSEFYFWYINCPKCAKCQGGEKTVIFAKID